MFKKLWRVFHKKYSKMWCIIPLILIIMELSKKFNFKIFESKRLRNFSIARFNIDDTERYEDEPKYEFHESDFKNDEIDKVEQKIKAMDKEKEDRNKNNLKLGKKMDGNRKINGNKTAVYNEIKLDKNIEIMNKMPNKTLNMNVVLLKDNINNNETKHAQNNQEKKKEGNETKITNEEINYKDQMWWKIMLCRAIQKRPDKVILLKLFDKEIFPHEDASKNIYLIENNCDPVLSWKTLCGLESAARQNPNASVFLLTVTSYIYDPQSVVTALLQEVSNIVIAEVNLNILFEGTPLQSFKSPNKWTDNSSYLNSHMSDGMRIALVWRSGGTYLDSDIISVRTLPSASDVLVYGTKRHVTGYFIKMSKHSAFLEKTMEQFVNHYKKNNWAANGPKLFTNVFKNFCQNSVSEKSSPCFGIQVLDHKAFSVTTWQKSITLFESNSKVDLNKYLSESYGVHYSNHRNGKLTMQQNTGSLFEKLIQTFCPLMIRLKNNFIQ